MAETNEIKGLKPTLKNVLVIANSGRMLAQFVRRAGYRPLVIDMFADQDTEAIAQQVWQVKNLSLAVIQETVEELLLTYKIQWFIYGGGVENQPETLTYLTALFAFTGNSAAICEQLSDKKNFFKQLDKLEIRYPEVSFCLPEKATSWLIKPVNHVGGIGISWCDRVANENEYYQRFCQGNPGSALFCSDGQQVEIIGFHQQWTLDNNHFVFSGIVQECLLPEAEQKKIQCWLEKLVSCYQFKGLASLDFIWTGEVCYFLEINPRPPASMQLYPELDLLTAHLTGQLAVTPRETSTRALQIVYAKQACKIQIAIEWPEWSLDRPKLHTNIQINEPICSIMAQESTVQQALNSLLKKQKIIENILY